MIKLKNVSVKYHGGDYALKNINLEIDEGKCLVLIGKSGCGKTSITRLINGLIPNYYGADLEGEVRINKLDLRKADLSTISKYVGSVFQNPKSQFFTTNTTSELVFSSENHGIDTGIIDKSLKSTVGLLDLEKLLNRDVFKLSAGEKQLIAAGSVYTYDPPIYVFDEPSSNLDIFSINKIRKLLKDLKNRGKTIILAEHRIYYLMDIADEFVYIDEGEIKSSFTSRELENIAIEKRNEKGIRITDPRELQASPKKHSIRKEISMSLRNLSVKRDRAEIVYIPKLDFNKGEIIAVIVSNGVGKSTLIESLMGLIDFQGSISISDMLMSKIDLLGNGFLVMQDVNRQIFSETVEDEVILGYEKDESRVDYLLKKLKISNYKYNHPASLSGGQRQRLAIASAIYSDKNMLFFDEPTSGLDKKSLMDFQDILIDVKNNFSNIFIVTHDPELILNLADSVLLFLDNRRIELIPMNNYGSKRVGNYFIKSMLGQY